MATGTKGGLLESPDQHAQSVFKHAVLSSYLEPFMAMTGSTSPGKRLVVVDGFAGSGRYRDGSPASGERIMQAIAKMRRTRHVEAFFVEKAKKEFAQLEAVVGEYRARGLAVTALHGRVEKHLHRVLAAAKGVPLFLFLDPCGAGVSFEELTGLLNGPRADEWPATEVLLNFSGDMSRRVAGALNNGYTNQRAMDSACGGQWWRPLAEKFRDDQLHQAGDTDGRRRKLSYEPFVNTIATEYARRVAAATGMHAKVLPVYRKLRQQPVYHLVFLTRAQYGLWVFADAAAHARKRWLEHLAEMKRREEEANPQPGLWDAGWEQEDVSRQETHKAHDTLVANLTELLQRRSAFKLVRETEAVFGDMYGVAGEDAVKRALDDLEKRGQARVIRQAGKKNRIREWYVCRPR